MSLDLRTTCRCPLTVAMGRASVGVVLAVALVVVACGSNGESLFTEPPAGSSSGNVDAGPTDPFGDRSDAAGDGGNDDGGAVCAAVNAEAKLVPVNMVVMYDRSGSMGDT